MRSLILMILFVASIFCSPLLAPYDPLQTNVDALSAPSREHLLGTDSLGRDVLSRMLHGGQHTITVSLLSLAAAVVLGLVLGVSAASNRLLSLVINALIDSLLAFPSLLGALLITTLLGRGTVSLIVATGLPFVAIYARFVHGVLLVAQKQPHVEAATALGASALGVTLRHVLFNVVPELTGYAAVIFAYCLSASAALSFLGFGAAPGSPDWGAMLQEGRRVMFTAPWVWLPAAIMLTSLVVMANRLGTRARPVTG